MLAICLIPIMPGPRLVMFFFVVILQFHGGLLNILWLPLLQTSKRLLLYMSVDYIKVQHLYRILILPSRVLLSFCVRIGAFDRFSRFCACVVFRVPCTFL